MRCVFVHILAKPGEARLNPNIFAFYLADAPGFAENPLSVNELGPTIRYLQLKQGLSGSELARLIGITAPSLSQIVNGHAKPRQGTFSKLCQHLAKEPEEEQQLVDAFIRLTNKLPRAMVLDSAEYEKAERERAERFLEVKTQSIIFKRSVARELDKAGLRYQADYCEGIYSTDFLVEHEGRRYAVECKFNVQRDMDKTIRIAEMLKEHFGCAKCYIVTPSATGMMLSNKLPDGITLVSDSKILKEIKQ